MTIIHYTFQNSALGQTLIAYSPKGLCLLTLDDDRDILLDDLQKRFPRAELIEDDHIHAKDTKAIVSFIKNPNQDLSINLDLHGTEFQKKVWDALLKIKAGQTATYTDIANRIKLPKSVRAVANACGANKIAVIIPCHRIIRNDGTLSGYRWGVDKKVKLLRSEGVTSHKE
jgi:AraC family transcriptional regulator of adaptative response/methylated-DNA-[protein]-cysteine methyltransferase